ncbi:hypothetical protein HNQ92_002384 [Rhabdobacter roseus]|uniref:O-antigen polymerase n=1 Tax=Rhabdobacter roseus TaxID=1655419 RepID=A0A840TL28_9BACT|nr:hypothetical protein [Rhabdobacter roseus]
MKLSPTSSSYILIFIIFFSIYSDVPLILPNGKWIPSFTTLLILPLIFIFIKNTFELDDIILFISFALLISFSLIINKIYLYGPISSLFKAIQFLVAILMGICVKKYIELIPKPKLKKILWISLFSILIGCTLERIGIIRPLTLAYKYFVYSGTRYGNNSNYDFRDLNISGFIRPILFTSEPSLVAVGFYVFSTSLSLLEDNKRTLLYILFACLIFITLSGSPIGFFSLVSWLGIWVRNTKGKILHLSLILFFLPILLLILFQIPFFYDIYAKIINRIFNEIASEGTSVYARIYFPYFILIPFIFKNYPLFGIGFGGREKFISLIYGQGVTSNDVNLDFTEGANAFARIFAYLGIIGAMLFLYILHRYIKSNSKSDVVLFFFLWFLLSQTLGTFETPRYWCFTFIILACFRK